jgi:hypothetical protein
MHTALTRLALATATLCAVPAMAETQFGDHVTLSGFGTLGVVASDKDDVDFVRDGAPEGAGKKESWKVDSKLGLQANFTATDWLSATVQVLAEQRYEPGVTAGFEWAFVKLKPVDGLNIRLGRIAPPMFMVSDTRNVGYANTLVRQPNEVYSLAGLKRLDGGDVSYAFGIGDTTLTGTVLAGESALTNTTGTLPAKNVRGVNLVWDTEYGSFRLGQVKADMVLSSALSGAPFDLMLAYGFTGVGYQWDNGKYVLNAEYVKRTTTPRPYDGFDTTGWYVTGGYRFGNFLPYVMVADAKVKNTQVAVTNGSQRTYAAGVRWDAVTGAAVKLQLEHVDPKGTLGESFSVLSRAPRVKTNVLSLAVDFVF